jgi:hypothetical protein
MAKERNVALAPGDFGTSPRQLQDEATFPPDTLQWVWQRWANIDVMQRGDPCMGRVIEQMVCVLSLP